MKGQIELLEILNRKIEKLSCALCAKMDALILAEGGSPVLYNTINAKRINAGDEYETPQAHAVSVTVIGTTGQNANLVINGIDVTAPAGYQFSATATTTFVAGHIKVQSSSTADVIVQCITE